MKKVISTALALLLMVSCLTGCNETTVTETVSESIAVAVTPAEYRDMSKTITLGGLLSPESEITVMAGGSGSKVTSTYVSVGDTVKKGQLLLSQDLTSVENQKETLEMNISQLEDTLALQTELNEMGAVADKDLESLNIQLEQLYIQLDTLNNSIDLMTVTSPINGIVSYFPLSVGQLAAASSVAAQIVNIDTLKLSVSVGESYITGIHKGDELSVMVPSVSEEPFVGVVDSIPPTVNSQTKSYIVTITIDNPDHQILGGMYGEIELMVDSHPNTLAVNTKSIVTVDGEPTVFVVSGKTAKAVNVTTGIKVGDYTEIVSGISSGDKVISKGQYTVYDGAIINIVEGN